ncbi:MAG: hypothetical protein EA351_03300 [Gemmatimonadales bacterium]|nr:MAG: hypothetical protein EA351_03300 [Gemmatimonadales bacterium]
MALLPTDRSKQVALLVCILALALIYVAYEYYWTPQRAEIEVLEVRLETLEDQNRRAQVLAARGGPELEERLAVYERHLSRLEQLIPAGQEVPVLLRQIASEALRTGVDMGGIDPQPTVEGEFYSMDAYQMNVIGEFHDVGRFLTSIASLERIITPVELLIEPAPSQPVNQQMESPVRARFRIETYISPRDVDPLDAEELAGGGP